MNLRHKFTRSEECVLVAGQSLRCSATLKITMQRIVLFFQVSDILRTGFEIKHYKTTCPISHKVITHRYA